MFAGRHNLTLEGDHVDLSYRDSGDWTKFTPSGSIRSHAFDFGDAEAGPRVHLSIVEPIEGEVLDWQHSIDPPHYHGTDQFRVIPGGEWHVANHSLPAGSYSFQESGIPYREHPTDGAPAWFMLLTGDRRGGTATLMMKKDQETLFKGGEDYGEPVADGTAYPHPAGRKGIAAIATTAGGCTRGYLHGLFADLPAGADDAVASLNGVLGDSEVGPLVHLLKAPGDAVLLPRSTYPTERMLLVVRGSVTIGDASYDVGDVRIQAADMAMDDIVGGPDGADVVLVIADRRAVPAFEAPAAAPGWVGEVPRP